MASNVLQSKDEILCKLCDNRHAMSMIQGRELNIPLVCSACCVRQHKKDPIHVCSREGDPGHRKTDYFNKKKVLIGKYTFILCYTCRKDGKDQNLSWELATDYWLRKTRFIPNEPKR